MTRASCLPLLVALLAPVALVVRPARARAEAGVVPAPADVAAPGAGVRAAPSGLAGKILARGHGRARAQSNDCVKVHYTGWRRDGLMIASSRREELPEVQCLRRVSPGVAEALRAMAVGEQRRIWVPARLAAGPGREDETAPPVAVTYDLELVGIIKAPATPPHLQAPPPRALRTPSGVALQVLQPGTGAAHPAAGSHVTVHMSGWRPDGTLVESTRMADHAAAFVVRELLPGLAEVVERMVVGQRVRAWIPSALAYGDKPRRGQPAGPLVYEIELLTLE